MTTPFASQLDFVTWIHEHANNGKGFKNPILRTHMKQLIARFSLEVNKVQLHRNQVNTELEGVKLNDSLITTDKAGTAFYLTATGAEKAGISDFHKFIPRKERGTKKEAASNGIVTGLDASAFGTRASVEYQIAVLEHHLPKVEKILGIKRK